jgi:hypothetical protein
MYRQNPGHLLNAYIYRNWDFIHLTRRYLNDIIVTLFNDRIFAEKVANSSSELIENAFKNSPPESDFNIQLSDTRDLVILQVKNYTVNDSETSFKIIKNELNKVYSEIDPSDSFKKRILEYASDPAAKWMLGFARIRLETNAKIEVKLEKEGLIVIKASFPKNN